MVYTFQAPVTRLLGEATDRFAENRDLTVSNARMFMTSDDGPPVLVACLNPGAASMATQLEHLSFLGDETRFAAIVGTAGALTTDYRIADTVVVSSALRTDGISDRYLPPEQVVEADPAFTVALAGSAGVGALPARSWTVPVPYRSNRSDLTSVVEAGASVVEMEIATLFAVSEALGFRAAATVVISDLHRVEGWEVDWNATTPPLFRAVLTTIEVMRSLA